MFRPYIANDANPSVWSFKNNDYIDTCDSFNFNFPNTYYDCANFQTCNLVFSMGTFIMLLLSWLYVLGGWSRTKCKNKGPIKVCRRATLEILKLIRKREAEKREETKGAVGIVGNIWFRTVKE